MVLVARCLMFFRLPLPEACRGAGKPEAEVSVGGPSVRVGTKRCGRDGGNAMQNNQDKEGTRVHQGDVRHPLCATVARRFGRASDGGSEIL